MDVIYSLLTGGLFGVSVYLLLQGSVLRLLFGIITLSSAINLLLFVAGGIGYQQPAFISSKVAISAMANPLPQALILTAIVIGFGLIAYCFVLVRCLWQQDPKLAINKSHTESEGL